MKCSTCDTRSMLDIKICSLVYVYNEMLSISLSFLYLNVFLFGIPVIMRVFTHPSENWFVFFILFTKFQCVFIHSVQATQGYKYNENAQPNRYISVSFSPAIALNVQIINHHASEFSLFLLAHVFCSAGALFVCSFLTRNLFTFLCDAPRYHHFPPMWMRFQTNNNNNKR